MFDTHPCFTLPSQPPGISSALAGAINRHDPDSLVRFFNEQAPAAMPIFRRVAADFIAHRRATPDALLILADAMREWMRETQLVAAASDDTLTYERVLAGTVGLPLVIEALETAASALAHAR